MKYERAVKIYKNLPVQVQREMQANMIEYFQSTPLLITLKRTKRRNRERRYFISLVDGYLHKTTLNKIDHTPP